MINFQKTAGFTAIQLSATSLINKWCQLVHVRFLQEHPDGHGAALSNFYWETSWVGIVGACLLTALVAICHIKKKVVFYDAVVMFGIWLLVVWFGFALIAMEVSFIGWIDPRGMHF